MHLISSTNSPSFPHQIHPISCGNSFNFQYKFTRKTQGIFSASLVLTETIPHPSPFPHITPSSQIKQKKFPCIILWDSTSVTMRQSWLETWPAQKRRITWYKCFHPTGHTRLPAGARITRPA